MSGEIEDANSRWDQGCLHPRSHLTCNAGLRYLRPALECGVPTWKNSPVSPVLLLKRPTFARRIRARFGEAGRRSEA